MGAKGGPEGNEGPSPWKEFEIASARPATLLSISAYEYVVESALKAH